LNNSVSVNAPEGFELSLTDDQNFTNSLTLSPENGKLDRIIFVRFVPGYDRGYYDFISINSGSINSNLKVSGNSR
jgi:hypothetical protein